MDDQFPATDPQIRSMISSVIVGSECFNCKPFETDPKSRDLKQDLPGEAEAMRVILYATYRPRLTGTMLLASSCYFS
jgi:hypothetical protein